MGKTSKVVVCGAKKCGKTSILEQAINGNVGVSTKHCHLVMYQVSAMSFT